MAVKVGINGFGRIGRLGGQGNIWKKTVRYRVGGDQRSYRRKDQRVIFLNMIRSRPFNGEVKASAEDVITVNGKNIKVLSKRDPAELPWKDLVSRSSLSLRVVYDQEGWGQ
jgi:glyceraldehyde 3-phosphate dehydrogenase